MKKQRAKESVKKIAGKQVDPARQQSLAILCDVLQAGQTLDEAFSAHASGLNPRDKNFAYHLCLTTLRYGLALDKISADLMTKPFPANSTGRLLLQLGLCQLFVMDGVKPHAAIATTVDTAKANKLGHMSGVINGVLRNAQRTFSRQDISPRDGLPPWLLQRLQSHYGAAAAAEMADALLTPAPLDIRTRTGAVPADATKLAGLPDGWRLPEGSKAASLHPQLEQGEVYIQDAAAQWPAHLLTQHLNNHPNNHTEPGSEAPLLDVCAAPGGKTLQLADHTNRHTVAADISAARLSTLCKNVQGTAAIHPLQADGFMPPFPDGTFGGILVDAPCTATGTIRRHPDVMHLRQTKDIKTLQTRQRALLKAMVPLLKKGAVVVYAVCSLLPEEGEAQNLWALENLPLKPLDIKNLPACFTNNQPTKNALRLTPLDGTDGFYIALYQKTD